jgi:hypothetical protein
VSCGGGTTTFFTFKLENIFRPVCFAFLKKKKKKINFVVYCIFVKKNNKELFYKNFK